MANTGLGQKNGFSDLYSKDQLTISLQLIGYNLNIFTNRFKSTQKEFENCIVGATFATFQKLNPTTVS